MQGIFISYRRQDSQSAAGRLADDIKEDVPGVVVFRDVETIEPGVDFSDAINRALQSCGVLLAVIGPRWLSVMDDAGRRRLDNPDDYTRIEIATALKRSDVRVIPILVEGATMPESKDLPDNLQALARRNALELTDGRWRYDISRLADTVSQALGVPAKPPATRNRQWIGFGAAALVLVATAMGYMSWRAQAPGTPVVIAPVTPPVAAPQSNEARVGIPTSPAPPAPTPGVLTANAAPVDPCPIRLSVNRELPTPFTCRCDAASISEGTTVWGSDVYTDDSSLCRAAVHVGVIPAGGGTVTVVRDTGRPLYVGSLRHGIQTSDYGTYSDSIHFVGAAQPVAGPQPCPTRLSINRSLPTPFTCRCDAVSISEGTAVWGSDVYTDDSSLCRAAVHVGVIPPAGGTVTVMRDAGRPLYVGSRRNGIQTSDYGAYSNSMHFQSR